MSEPAIPEHKGMGGRLAIPYVTPAGVIGFAFRCVRHPGAEGCVNHAKIIRPGLKTRFFNVRDLHEDTMQVHIAEGEIDTITLSKECDLPAVGVPGATNWKPWWKEVLDDFSHIYVFCDNDSAGSGLGRKLQKELGRRVILLEFEEPGMDVNSAFVKYGRDYIRNMIPKESK